MGGRKKYEEIGEGINLKQRKRDTKKGFSFFFHIFFSFSKFTSKLHPAGEGRGNEDDKKKESFTRM